MDQAGFRRAPAPWRRRPGTAPRRTRRRGRRTPLPGTPCSSVDSPRLQLVTGECGLLDESSVQECMVMKLGSCLRFWIVVGQVVPLHPVHPPARLRRRRGELGLRVHLPDARVAAEQVAGLHREHPAASPTHTCTSPIRTLTIRTYENKLELYTDRSLIKAREHLRESRAVVDLRRLRHDDGGGSRTDAPPSGRDTGHHRAPRRRPGLGGQHGREPDGSSGSLHFLI